MCNNKSDLLELIRQKAVFRHSDFEGGALLGPKGEENSWVVDIRNLLLNPQVIDFISDQFWVSWLENREIQGKPLQIAGLELAAVPLITAITLKAQNYDVKASGLIIRKSRKKYGLQRTIEGAFDREVETVIVDDLVNSGASIHKCLVSLAEVGIYPKKVFSVIDFGSRKKQELFNSRGLKHNYLVSGEEIVSRKKEEKNPDLTKYGTRFCFRSPTPSGQYRIFCKSNPIVDDNHVYFGTDFAVFYALNKRTGLCKWKFEGQPNRFLKGIWSSPCFVGDKGICFGAYDGHLYCLNRESGEVVWTYQDADFIGSSPIYVEPLNLIFVGVERGLPGRQGAIVALDAKTGQTVWQHETSEFVHSTPVYSSNHNIVFCGTNEFEMLALDAQKGHILWRFKFEGITKMQGVLNQTQDKFFICGTDSSVRALDVHTGNEIWRYKTHFGNLATPLLVEGLLVIGSLDNCIHILNADNGKVLQKIQTEARIMSQPSYYNGDIFIGNNAGAIYVLRVNPNWTGLNKSKEVSINIEVDKTGLNEWPVNVIRRHQLPDRILSKIAYCEQTRLLYVHTGDDRLFALEELDS